jgi:uncharacterized protein YciI
MKTKVSLLSITLILAACIPLGAQQKTEAEFKLVEFQMALIKRSSQVSSDKSSELDRLTAEHHVYIKSLLESGKAVISGPVYDGGDLLGVSIFRTKSPEEAKSLAENDPLVKAGHATIEMHPWWSEEVMKKPAVPIKMTTAYLGFLVRGAKWTPEKTPQTEQLQKDHLANINRLAEMKKLVVAGPFGDNGQLRGIFVFKVNSLDEAKDLASTDPAVQAGRLEINMYKWLVPEGVLP